MPATPMAGAPEQVAARGRSYHHRRRVFPADVVHRVHGRWGHSKAPS